MQIAGKLKNSEFIILEDKQAIITQWNLGELRLNSLKDGQLMGMMYNSPLIVKYWWMGNNRLLVLTKKGQLIFWNLTNLQTSETKLRTNVNDIKAAVLHQTEESYCYTLSQNGKYFQAINLENGKENSSKSFERRITSTSANNLDLLISNDQKFLIEVNGKNIWIYDLIHKEFIRKIKLKFKITAFSLSNNDKVLAIGDTRGKINQCFNMFSKDKEFRKVESHWHVGPVKTLTFNSNDSLLISGGTEGVILIQHLTSEKRTFCPRLGNTILRLQFSNDNEKVYALMESNEILEIIFQDYKITSLIQGCNLQINNTTQTVTKYSQEVIVVNEGNQLNLYNLKEQKQTAIIDVVNRNYLKQDSDCQLQIDQLKNVQFCFSRNRQLLLTYEKRPQGNQDGFYFNQLKFFERDPLSNKYGLISSKHVNQKQNLKLTYYQDEENMEDYFITYSDQGDFQIWRTFEKKRQKMQRSQEDTMDTEPPQTVFIWDVLYQSKIYSDKLLQIIKDTQNTLIFVFSDSIKYFNLKSLQLENSFRLDFAAQKVLQTKEYLILASSTHLHSFDKKNKECSLLMKISNVKNMIYFENDDLLFFTVDIKDQNKSWLFSFKLTSNQLDVISIDSTIDQLVNYDNLLLLLTDTGNMIVYTLDLQKPTKFYRKRIAIQEKTNKNTLKILFNKARVDENGQDFFQTYKQIHQQPKILLSDLISEQSHVIPSSSILFRAMVDKILIKNGVDDDNNEQNWFQNYDNKQKMEIEEEEESSYDSSDEQELFEIDKIIKKPDKNNKNDQLSFQFIKGLKESVDSVFQ